MEFRRFAEQDLPACTEAFLAVFNGEPWYDQWSYERASRFLSDLYHTPNFLGILAVNEGEIVGFAYGVTTAWWEGDEFYIHQIGVMRQWRGQGIGRALLAQLAKALAASGVHSFTLLTDRGTAAEAFYRKNGFVEIERLVFYSRDF